jgi:hypothetical protein
VHLAGEGSSLTATSWTCYQGVSVLVALRVYVNHGVDLRNRDHRRTWDERQQRSVAHEAERPVRLRLRRVAAAGGLVMDPGAPSASAGGTPAAGLPPGSSRRSYGQGCSRRTRCSGGRPRVAPAVSSGGLKALPRRHRSMTATWQPSRRGSGRRLRRVHRTSRSGRTGHGCRRPRSRMPEASGSAVGTGRQQVAQI